MSGSTVAEPVVVAEDLVRRHARGAEVVTALDRVSVEVRGGAVTVVTGPSGSGKTTLCLVLAGFDEPDEGTVRRPGGAAGSPPGWHEVAVVPQRLALVAAMTVGEQLWLAERTAPADEVGAALHDAVVEGLDLGHLLARRPEELSQGERQRAAIARALVATPRLVVLDEPTSSQDEDHVALVLNALDAAAARGAAVVVASHDERVVERADEVVHLVDGRRVDRGAP